jgi:hypothetical protein
VHGRRKRTGEARVAEKLLALVGTIVRSPRVSALSSLVTLTILATACSYSYVRARSVPFVDRPAFPPTDPATVEILLRPPMRPQDILGQVILEPEGDPSQSAIEEKLREETAQMGGSAAVIVFDRRHWFGSMWTGVPWWSGGGQTQHVGGEAISAIVIRYVTAVEP